MPEVNKKRQAELNGVYESIKQNHRIPETLTSRLSCPLLLKIPEGWYESDKRVLVVGQETLGWGFRQGEYYAWPHPDLLAFTDFVAAQDSVLALVDGYAAFEYARHQPDNYRSPFWQAYRQIRQAVGNQPDGLDTSVLWTNLFRMALDETSVVKRGTLEETKVLQSVSASVLQREIEILNPSAVVFYTGPDYDGSLLGTFEGAMLTVLDGYSKRELAAVAHPALPAKSYRSYHPGYQNRSGKWGITDWICQQLS
ncbi:Uncharacterised protein [Burkholderia pseudomallei]|uniref:hypothetical protein n=1 Tax=Burkholderia pseudomallei TaxID=28450 RepID=UPI000F2B616A|nr:hypothetical protein [Burkholderia pseudomallei]CAJ7237864.1 Uncharacterised protein [Burkholderia pseudomallei]VBC15449.1 Uncharacterised protein [Burkholderia pseudomallei]VBS98752.1 Uncharacterised protein [Burkholderia pseudomallei]